MGGRKGGSERERWGQEGGREQGRKTTALTIVERMVGWTTVETGKGKGVYMWEYTHMCDRVATAVLGKGFPLPFTPLPPAIFVCPMMATVLWLL